MPKLLMIGIGGHKLRKGIQKEPLKRKWLYLETMTYEKWDRGQYVTIFKFCLIFSKLRPFFG